MGSNKKLLSHGLALGITLGLAGGTVYASEITDTYTTGDTLTAAKMNNIKSAVNDNNTRITNVLTGTGACQGNDATDVMVRVGSLCVDKYEASVWSTKAAGGTQYGNPTDDYPCLDGAGDCKDVIYARSQAGAHPAVRITWFQAQQACANSGKRLLTNAEWQMAAAGGVETACNINTAGPVNTGTGGTSCESARGAADMVGNVWEWVADWFPGQGAVTAANTTTLFGGDMMEGIAPATNQGTAGDNFPAALIRGGHYADDTLAGAFALSARYSPSDWRLGVGFRCGR